MTASWWMHCCLCDKLPLNSTVIHLPKVDANKSIQCKLNNSIHEQSDVIKKTWYLVNELWGTRAFGNSMKWYHTDNTPISSDDTQYTPSSRGIAAVFYTYLYIVWFTDDCQNTECQLWFNIDPLSGPQDSNWMCWYLVTTYLFTLQIATIRLHWSQGIAVVAVLGFHLTCLLNTAEQQRYVYKLCHKFQIDIFPFVPLVHCVHVRGSHSRRKTRQQLAFVFFLVTKLNLDQSDKSWFLRPAASEPQHFSGMSAKTTQGGFSKKHSLCVYSYWLCWTQRLNTSLYCPGRKQQLSIGLTGE